MTAALAQLHAKYGTAANASAYKSVGYPLGYQNNPVQIAWDAIMENHFIPFPMDFYSNKTVCTQLQPAAASRLLLDCTCLEPRDLFGPVRSGC